MLRKQKIIRGDFLDDLMGRYRLEHAAYYGGVVWIFAMFSRWAAAHDVSL